MTTSNAGGRPVPHESTTPPTPGAPVMLAAVSGRMDLERLTRVTPSTLRRRDIRRATERWPGVQPLTSIAGEPIAPRIVEAPPLACPDTVPLSDFSVTSAGMAREMPRSDCSQSNREPARSRTVEIRASASAWKSAYGLSFAASAATALPCALTAVSLASRSLMVLFVTT